MGEKEENKGKGGGRSVCPSGDIKKRKTDMVDKHVVVYKVKVLGGNLC